MAFLTPQITMALIDATKTLILACMLLWYMQHRRYPKDRDVVSLRAWLGYYIGEILLGCAMVPSLTSLSKLIPS